MAYSDRLPPFCKEGHRTHHLKDHDYTRKATFFITFNTHKSAPILCSIEPETARVRLTVEGQCVENAIQAVPRYYPFIQVDHYVIMSTHIHGIFVFGKQVAGQKFITSSDLVGRIKSRAGHDIRQTGCFNFAWHHDHYDMIIRNQQQLATIRKYIRNNPVTWLKEERE